MLISVLKKSRVAAKDDGNPAHSRTDVSLSCFDSKDGPQSARHTETVPV
jgi:hypothetical protein